MDRLTTWWLDLGRVKAGASGLRPRLELSLPPHSVGQTESRCSPDSSGEEINSTSWREDSWVAIFANKLPEEVDRHQERWKGHKMGFAQI